jgi:hypothetical protein
MNTVCRLGWGFALGMLLVAPARAADNSGYPAKTPATAVSYGVWGNSSSNSSNCADLGCDNGSALCAACNQDPCCCSPLWRHRSGVLAEMLFLRPGNVDVIYAEEQTSFDPVLASPTGPLGRANIDNGTGFRLGVNWAMDDCASLAATYTWFDSDTEDQINATPGNVLDLIVGHPSVVTSGATSISATAAYDIDFQLLDVDYRGLLRGTCDSAVNCSVGLRYAHLSQDFLASQEIFSAVGLTTVATQIDFDGVGIRFGLDGVKRRAGTGLLLYAKGDVNFVGGEFQANYRQANQFGGAAVIGNDFSDYRLITIADAELGLGWESTCGRLRVTGGYLVSGWFNTLTTGSYIDGVRASSFTDLSETLTFDGLVTRVELRY